MWNRIKLWWKAEGALVGLQGVSDRMLEDMGLEREGLRDRVLARSDQRDATAAVEDGTVLRGPRGESLACAKPC